MNESLESTDFIATPSTTYSVEGHLTYTYPQEGGWVWFSTDLEAKVLITQRLEYREVEQKLISFAAQKDIEVGEVAMLLQSSNLDWVLEAQTFTKLWDDTWNAFYNGTAYPELKWD